MMVRKVLAILLLWLTTPATTNDALAQCETSLLTEPLAVDYGRSVALAADLAIVGDPGYGPNYLETEGAIFVYQRAGWGSWVLLDTLRTMDAHPGTGSAVASDGDVIVAGHSGAPHGDDRGVVYIFRRNRGQTTWGVEQILSSGDGREGWTFGRSVALEGETVVVGAWQADSNGISLAGAVYVLERAAAGWVVGTRLSAPLPQEVDLFGQSVAISGDVIAVGGHGRGVEVGAVWIFRRRHRTWAHEATLESPRPGRPWFGYSISLAGERLVVGAPETNGQEGAAYVFDYNSASRQWVLDAELRGATPVGVAPWVGNSTAISQDGTTILIGALRDEYREGAAYLFTRGDGKWVQVARLLSADPSTSRLYGTSVSLDGDRALIGAVGGSHTLGTAHIVDGILGIDCNANSVPDACDIASGTSADTNRNEVPDECEERGDLNGDGMINVEDLLLLLSSWGPCAEPCPGVTCAGDLNQDCEVGILDLLALLISWP